YLAFGVEPVGSKYQQGVSKLLITKKTHSSLLDKTQEVEGTLYVSKGKLRLETPETVIVINGENLTVITPGEKNHVLKGKMEQGVFKDLASMDFKDCKTTKEKTLCGPTTFVFKDKELVLI